MRFNSILVANRGEIACRIMQTAQFMGIKCIAVFVDADKDAPFVKMADEAIKLSSGYMDGSAIIDAAIAIWSRSNPSRIWIFIRKCSIC